jgi:hypothetical protein
VNTSSKPIPAPETLSLAGVAKQPFAPPGGFAMWRRARRPSVSETEKVRGGSRPLDNLVVLITSLTLRPRCWPVLVLRLLARWSSHTHGTRLIRSLTIELPPQRSRRR